MLDLFFNVDSNFSRALQIWAERVERVAEIVAGKNLDIDLHDRSLRALLGIDSESLRAAPASLQICIKTNDFNHL